MRQVGNNLVDLAEFRRRRAGEVAATAAPAPPVPTQMPYPGFFAPMRMIAVPCVWVPVWVPVATPYVEHHRAEGINA